MSDLFSRIWVLHFFHLKHFNLSHEDNWNDPSFKPMQLFLLGLYIVQIFTVL